MDEMPKYKLRIRVDPKNVIDRMGGREGTYPVRVYVMTVRGVRTGEPVLLNAFDEDPYAEFELESGYYRAFVYPDKETRNEVSTLDFYLNKDTTRVLQLK